MVFSKFSVFFLFVLLFLIYIFYTSIIFWLFFMMFLTFDVQIFFFWRTVVCLEKWKEFCWCCFWQYYNYRYLFSCSFYFTNPYIINTQYAHDVVLTSMRRHSNVIVIIIIPMLWHRNDVVCLLGNTYIIMFF